MYAFEVAPLLLVTLFAGALAFSFDYFPRLAVWFDGLTTAAKRGVNALGVAGVAVIIFLGQCFGLFSTNLVCSAVGFVDLLYIIFLGITVNQGVHLALKPSERIKARIFRI